MRILLTPVQRAFGVVVLFMALNLVVLSLPVGVTSVHADEDPDKGYCSTCIEDGEEIPCCVYTAICLPDHDVECCSWGIDCVDEPE